jgi:hypothetical protein
MLRELEAEQGEKTFYREHSAAAMRKALPRYLKRSEREHESFIVRPRGGHLLQVDDCTLEVEKQLRPFSFVTVCTSPRSFQCWLAFESKSEIESVRVRLFDKLKSTGANNGGNGALRFPGSFNCKLKHRRSDDTFPRVFMLSTFNRMTTLAELEAAHLLAPLPEPKSDSAPRRATSTRDKHAPARWPDYARCLSEKNGDRSRADESFACIALSFNWLPSDVEAKLLEISDKAKDRRHGLKYVRKTVAEAVRYNSTRNH